MTDMTLQELGDRQAITDLLVRYCTALDTRDWPLLRSCFTADGVVDYGDYGGQHDPAGTVAHCRGGLEGLDVTQHLIANVAIELDGDRASAVCYVHAQHTLTGADGGDNFMIGGQYRDRLVRTAEGWRFAYRSLIGIWSEGNPAVFHQGVEQLVAAGGEAAELGRRWQSSVNLPDPSGINQGAA
jgi:hypothetical protein